MSSSKSPESIKKTPLIEVNAFAEKIENRLVPLIKDCYKELPNLPLEKLTPLAQGFLRQYKKMEGYLDEYPNHDMKKYFELFQTFGAALAKLDALKQRNDELKRLKELFPDFESKKIGTYTSEQRQTLIDAYLPANATNNELEDLTGEKIDPKTGKETIDQRALLPTLRRELQKKYPKFSVNLEGFYHGVYVMTLKNNGQKIGELHLPKNPNQDPKVLEDLKTQEVKTFPYLQEGEEAYLFRLKLDGEEDENFTLEKGYTDQKKTLPSIEERISYVLDKLSEE